jgi:hypothetical protein
MRKTRSILGCVPLLAILAAGCNSYRFDLKEPAKVKEAQIVVPAARPTPADILFVVDNSGSMEDKQIRVAQNFDKFIQQIQGVGDYRIGVVTGDVDPTTMEEAGDVALTHEMSSPWAFKGTDRSACMATSIAHGCVRGPGPQATWIVDSSMDPQTQIDTFRKNVRVGTCTGGEEDLNGMLLALKNAVPGGCNQNFIRKEANLVVIILTDEDDQDVGTGTPDNPMPRDIQGYFIPALQSAFAALDKPISQMRMAAIVGADKNAQPARCSIDMNGQPTTCGSLCNQTLPQGSLQPCGRGTQCPMGEYCDPTAMQCKNGDLANWGFCYWCPYYAAPDCCTGLTATRYIGFTRAVGALVAQNDPSIPAPVMGQECNPPEGTRTACLVASICQDDFSSTLVRIAKDLVLSTEYTLDPPATYPPGVVVKINGMQLQYMTDYTVSADGSKVQITGAHAPKAGDEVEIYFVISS